MKKSSINFRYACKYLSDFSILLVALVFISRFFIDLGYWNSNELRNILLIVYLISSLYFYKAELKDKKQTILKLKQQIKKLKNG